jgi:hypothetical protein
MSVHNIRAGARPETLGHEQPKETHRLRDALDEAQIATGDPCPSEIAAIQQRRPTRQEANKAPAVMAGAKRNHEWPLRGHVRGDRHHDVVPLRFVDVI